jgi:hypothetical protein
MVSFVSMRALDTSEKAAALQDELHDRLGPGGRIQLAMRLSDLAREFAKAGLRSRRPDIPEADLSRELVRELYGK